MVAQGDLGMEIPPEKVFLAQKMMICQANLAGKPIITATQMLESMINNPRPSRAECSDVANAVCDGTDWVMLSGEMANGPYFESAVNVMVRTCVEAEGSINFDGLHQAIRNSSKMRYSIGNSESIASSAVKTAIDINAKIILVLSETGATARAIAKFRPNMPVAVVARQWKGILKGCYSFVAHSLKDADAIIDEVNSEIVETGVAEEGDLFVIACGTLHGSGSTNQIKVERVLASSWNEIEDEEMSPSRKGRNVVNIPAKCCSIM